MRGFARRLGRSKADAAGLAFLGLVLAGSGAWVLLGGDGFFLLIFAVTMGMLAGWAGAYLLTKPRRHRRLVAAALVAGFLAPYVVSFIGLASGAWRPVLGGAFVSVGGAFWFGLGFGLLQVIRGRSQGRGFWAED